MADGRIGGQPVISEIRIYVEGGGDSKNTRHSLKSGFRAFFNDLVKIARDKGISFNIIACGSRRSTYDDFRQALHDHDDAFNLLLVDAEAPFSCQSPWDHLRNCQEDKWTNPGVDDERCHLMVQTMEAWLIADCDKLNEYYGKGFNANALPKNPHVELVDKNKLLDALKQATRDTKKGEYHKTHHAPGLLEKIRADAVGKKAPNCMRLFQVIRSKMDAA